MALKTVRSRLAPAPGPRIKPLPTEGGNNAAHYQSDGHKAWALAVKKRDGFRCVVCGAHGPGVRLIADHVIEIEDGGARFDLDNGACKCLPCHNRKTAVAKAARVGKVRPNVR